MTFVTQGKTLTNKPQARAVPTQSVKTDLPAVSGNALPVSLLDLKLGGTSAFKTSDDPDIRADELLVFVNGVSATGMNRAAPLTYYYFDGAWRKVGDDPGNPPDRSSEVLPAGATFLIRKASGAASSSTWSQPAK